MAAGEVAGHRDDGLTALGIGLLVDRAPPGEAVDVGVGGGGGWVDKFMGDGMLAVFGAPDPLENHAHSAFTAATAMVREVKQISPLAMGVGVHSGPVVAGCLGTSGRLEFTVIGDTANVAARLEALTKTLGHPLLVSAATREQLGSWPLQSVGHHPIRGRAQGIELFMVP